MTPSRTASVVRIVPLLAALATCASPVGGGATARAATFRFGDLAITVPDGFAVERAAAPPLVERPVSLAFDDEGAVYVAESSGSNAKLVEQQADPRHRVLRLVDTDGDGVFDRRTVFATGLEMLQGTLWHRGSLYVASGPRILRLTDTDGDGTADERSVWFDGGTLTGCGNDMHGPALGRDGWFYWCKGAFAEQTHDLPGRPGWKTRAAHVFRARPDRPVRAVEPVMTGGMDNPVDVAFSAAGERFVSATFLEHPAGGKRDGVIHALYGGVYGKEHGVLDGHPHTGDLLPPLVQLGPAAACGLHVHSGFGLGPAFVDTLLVCSFNLRTVTRHTLVPAGGTFTTVDAPFLTADSADFHPTDVVEDADGSVLVVDTGGWYKLCCPTSQLEKPAVLGGIYRVRRAAAPAVADPRGREIDWEALDDDAAVALLADPRPAVVDRAIDRAARRGATAVPALTRLLASAPLDRARQAAVWAAMRIDIPAVRPLLLTALADRAPAVRQAAAHATGLLRERSAVPPLAALLADADAGTARAAAEALGRIGGSTAAEALLAARPPTGDRATEHSRTHALIECGWPAPLLPALRDPDPGLRRMALVALAEMAVNATPVAPPGDAPLPAAADSAAADSAATDTAAADAAIKRAAIDRAAVDPNVIAAAVIAACRDDDADLRDAGWWLASRQPETATALAPEIAPVLERAARAPAEAPRIVGRCARLVANPAVAAAVAAVCRDGSADAARVAREVMRTARPAATPDAWIDALVARIGPTDVAAGGVGATAAGAAEMADMAATADAVDTLARLAVSPGQRARVRPAAVALAAAPATPPKLRVLAADAAGPAAGLPEEVIDRLVALILSADAPAEPPDAVPAPSPLDRSAAVAAVAAARPPVAVLLRLAPALARLPANDVATLLPPVTAAGGDTAIAAVAALADHPDPAALPRDAVAALAAALPDGRRDAAARLLAGVDAARATAREAFERLAATLPPGDAARGHAVFASSRAACTACHAMAYVGGKVGPDLSRIGAVRTPRDLLEAIVLPSASFVRSYEPVTVLTVDGRGYQGVVREDTAAGIVLQSTATTVERIPRDRIESVEPGTVSLMPKGYDTLLSPQELADLVAFLARAK